jgi:magnesium-dependent phosphatase 1
MWKKESPAKSSWTLLFILLTSVYGFSMKNTSPSSISHGNYPKLVVFDLDNTIWTPELYQLRKLERGNRIPVAGKDVKLFKGSQTLIQAIRRNEYPRDMKFAVASRTKSVSWAHDLLEQFRLQEILDYIEIFPGNKVAHFSNLKEQSSIPFDEMLFFDDSRDGKYGNCEPVSELGVLTVHCPQGLTEYAIIENALKCFASWDKSPSTIIESDGSMASFCLTTERVLGICQKINSEKRYGFIRMNDQNKIEVFFHFSSLQKGVSIEQGDKLSFVMKRDATKGKLFAAEVKLEK